MDTIKFCRKILFVLTAMLLSMGAAPQGMPAAAVFRASQPQGEVSVIHQGETQALLDHGKLVGGDVIRTGADSQVDLIRKGKWGYRLLANTECSIDLSNVDETRVKMTAGDVVFQVKKLPPGKTLVVETPVVVAAVRGTQFWGRVTPAGPERSATFAVREGRVEMKVSKTGEPFALEAGQAVDIHEADGSAAVRDALPAELGAIAQADAIPV